MRLFWPYYQIIGFRPVICSCIFETQGTKFNQDIIGQATGSSREIQQDCAIGREFCKCIKYCIEWGEWGQFWLILDYSLPTSGSWTKLNGAFYVHSQYHSQSWKNSYLYYLIFYEQKYACSHWPRVWGEQGQCVASDVL